MLSAKTKPAWPLLDKHVLQTKCFFPPLIWHAASRTALNKEAGKEEPAWRPPTGQSETCNWGGVFQLIPPTWAARTWPNPHISLSINCFYSRDTDAKPDYKQRETLSFSKGKCLFGRVLTWKPIGKGSISILLTQGQLESRRTTRNGRLGSDTDHGQLWEQPLPAGTAQPGL